MKNNIVFFCLATLFLSSCTNSKTDIKESSNDKTENISNEVKSVDTDSIDYKKRDNETMRGLFKK